jgi:hypothetical protein
VNLLLHAITRGEATRAPPAGVRGQRVLRVAEVDLAAWATQFRERPDGLTRADLLSHHEVVTLLHDQLDAAVPARFPTWVADGEALRRVMAGKHTQLSASLTRVRGRVELSLTAIWLTDDDEAAAAPEAATPGRRYLLQRRQAFAGSDRRRQRAGELADQLEHLVGPDLVEGQRQVCPSRTIALAMSLLVPRSRTPEVKARLGRVEPDVRILVNGPWPPYSFVDVR